MHDEDNCKTREYQIFVNAQKKEWSSDTITYSQVVDLAFPSQTDTQMFTVQYSRGPNDNRQGTLVEGQSVEVKNGMAFDVTRTDKS